MNFLPQNLKKFVKSANVITNTRKAISVLSSPKTIAVLKVFAAVITLCQAVDLYNDSNRKIGFKK